MELFRRLRAGQQPDDVARQMQDRQAIDSIASSYQRHLAQSFLLTLLQSTAPLRTIVERSSLV